MSKPERVGKLRGFENSPLKRKEVHTLGLLEHISLQKQADTLIRRLPQLSGILPVLRDVFQILETNTQLEKLTDFPGQLGEVAMVASDTWWANYASSIAGSVEGTKKIVMKVLGIGNEVMSGGPQPSGSYWERFLHDESISNNDVKITGSDGVHVQEIVVDGENISPGLVLKQAAVQVSIEALANISAYATEERSEIIPRTGRIEDRVQAKKNAQATLDHMKTLCTSDFEGCNSFDEVQARARENWTDNEPVQIVRPDGFYILKKKEDFLSLTQSEIQEMMTGNRENIGPYLSVAELDTDRPAIRYFDILGLSHINQSLTLDYQTHDMTPWYDNENVPLNDRKLSISPGAIGFKVRLMGAGGEKDYIDVTVDTLMSLPVDQLERQLQNCSEKPDWIQRDEYELAQMKDEPPLIVLSLSDGNKKSSIYEHRAADGKALAHLVFNTKTKTIELMYSHGPDDGTEAKAIALAGGYAVGTKEEEITDDFFIYPTKRKDDSLQRVEGKIRRAFGEPTPYKDKQRTLDSLSLGDVVSLRKISYSKLDTRRKNINDAFQKPLSNVLIRTLEEFGITDPKEQDALASILTPGLGMSNLISFVSEKVFGKTSVCVQPLIKKHRLSLALAPYIRDLIVKLKLTDPKFNLEETRSKEDYPEDVRDLQSKLIAATHQTNLFAKLSLGHIQILYLAAHGWRGLAEKLTGWVQKDLVEPTLVRAQISTLGGTTEKGFAKVINPRTKRPPSVKSFITALSGEKYLTASIGLEGNALSFRTRITPELMDHAIDKHGAVIKQGIDIDYYRLQNSHNMEKVVEKMCPEGMSREAFRENMRKQSGIFERRKSQYPHLDNSELIVQSQLSCKPQEWTDKAQYLQALILVALEDKIDGFVADLDAMTKNLESIATTPEFILTPEKARGLEERSIHGIS